MFVNIFFKIVLDSWRVVMLSFKQHGYTNKAKKANGYKVD